MTAICRSCSNKGLDLYGLPCVCGQELDPLLDRENALRIQVTAYAQGMDEASRALQSKALEEFICGEDKAAKAVRDAAKDLKKRAHDHECEAKP